MFRKTIAAFFLLSIFLASGSAYAQGQQFAAFPPDACDTGGVIKWNGVGSAASCHEYQLSCFGGIYYVGQGPGVYGSVPQHAYGNPTISSSPNTPQVNDSGNRFRSNPQSCPAGFSQVIIGDAMCMDSGLPNRVGSETTAAPCAIIMCVGSTAKCNATVDRPAPPPGSKPNSYSWWIENEFGDAGTCMNEYYHHENPCNSECKIIHEWRCDRSTDPSEYRTITCRQTQDGANSTTGDGGCASSVTARDDPYANPQPGGRADLNNTYTEYYGFRRRTCAAPIGVCRCDNGSNFPDENADSRCPNTFEEICDTHPNCVCGNGVCTANESEASCPEDCGPPEPTAVCGDGVCEAGEETIFNCPDDCGLGIDPDPDPDPNVPIPPLDPVLDPDPNLPLPLCGDGICSGGEENTCVADCGPPELILDLGDLTDGLLPTDAGTDCTNDGYGCCDPETEECCSVKNDGSPDDCCTQDRYRDIRSGCCDPAMDTDCCRYQQYAAHVNCIGSRLPGYEPGQICIDGSGFNCEETVCGDGACDVPMETPETCPSDCPSP